MKLFHYAKDGGKDSTVWGFWLIEWKRFFSAALLCFENGSRDAYHSHAFNSVSWVLKGGVHEHHWWNEQTVTIRHRPSWRPVFTARDTFHKVESVGRTWVLTFRGPWADRWREWRPLENRSVTLTHGRVEVA